MNLLQSLASTAVNNCGAPPEGRLLWVCVGAGIFAVIYGTVVYIKRARKP